MKTLQIISIKSLNHYFGDLKALNEINKTSGQIFNIGGGPNNTLSLLDLISIIETRIGGEIKPSFQDWRPGDQRVYISNIEKSKNISLDKFIYSIGIRHIGQENAKIIANYFNSNDNFQKLLFPLKEKFSNTI